MAPRRATDLVRWTCQAKVARGGTAQPSCPYLKLHSHGVVDCKLWSVRDERQLSRRSQPQDVPNSDELRAGKREVAATARRLGVCPACGRTLDGPGYGTGRIADGNFCSLGCVADFWYDSTACRS